MKNIEFNTQICTTIEQSKRLLELGLDDDTADMFHPAQHIGKDIVRYSDSPMRVQEEHFEIFVDDLPAWSLHRLIAMLPDEVKMLPEVIKNIPEGTEKLSMATIINRFVPKLTKNYVFYTDWCGWRKIFNENDNIYDNIIDCIEWLIKDGHFNKEYLKEE